MAKRGYKTKKELEAAIEVPRLRPIPSLQLIKANLKVVKRNFEATTVIVVMPALLVELSGIIGGDKFEISTRTVVAGVVAILAISWMLASTGAIYIMQLQAIGGQYIRIRDCYRYGFRYIPRLFGLAVIVGLTVLVSALLLVIPGLIMLRRYLLAPLYMVDENIGIRQAMDRSAAVTKPASRTIYGTLLIMFVFAVAAVIINKYLPLYGSAISVLLAYGYIYILALRYRELALGMSVQSLFEEPAGSKASTVKK